MKNLGHFRNEVFVKKINFREKWIEIEKDGKLKKHKLYKFKKEGYYFRKSLNLLFYGGIITFQMITWENYFLERDVTNAE